MKNHIENIRKSVKNLGYIPTSQQIKKAIDKICPDGKEILPNKSAIVAEVISYFQSPNTNELANTNEPEIEIDIPTQISTNQPDTLQHDNLPNEENTDTPILFDANHQSGFAPADKQDLIASQAIALGIELSDVEVNELATNIKDNFLDYETFVENAIDTIVNYAEYRSDRLEQKIRNARKQIEGYRQQLNQTLVGEFRELNSFFRQGAAKRQELSRQIAEAFKI
ncbi:MAG: hypothetical protein KME23_07625 [Goleter apudmare HA4340-LM2]|jgi:hypothetical protein|nr:hypothetical protein [Goleter apudmare HA4340-LM2]